MRSVEICVGSEHSLIVGNVALIGTDGVENQADLNNLHKHTIHIIYV